MFSGQAKGGAATSGRRASATREPPARKDSSTESYSECFDRALRLLRPARRIPWRKGSGGNLALRVPQGAQSFLLRGHIGRGQISLGRLFRIKLSARPL